MPHPLRFGHFSRRSFLTGSAAAVCLPRHAFAQTAQYDIKAVSRILEVNGKAAKVFGLETNGSLKGLTTRYGEPFRARVTNALSEDTMIHWHGLTPPIAMDGVPMLSGPAMKPGEERRVEFMNSRTGTHWMHSHVGLQEQKLLAAPLIVQEAGEALVDEQEHVIMLHDFTFRDPAEILAELKAGGGGHAAHMTHGAHAGHATSTGEASQMPESMQASSGGMASDIVFDAMLANDRTLNDPEVVQAEKAGRFRLRIINGAAATNFWIDLGDIEGQLIAVDGNAIHPVKGKRFPLAIAQRADIRLSLPAGSGSWPIYFHAEGLVQRAAIVLRAGEGAIAKLGDAPEEAPALDVTFDATLKSIAELPDEPVIRSEFVMLTGGGPDYLWGLNDKSGMHDVVMRVREGERYEIIMHNMTGMAHPMHLHGHYFKVTGINGKRVDGPLRDTVLVPVNAMVAIQFMADNPGTWAFHCHHLYHMNSGMMGALAYADAA